MKKYSIMILCLLLFCLISGSAIAGPLLKMSTTTSTQASGLLDLLLPAFKKETGIDVKVVAKGTGAALRDGMDGNVDVIFVHAREREEKFVMEGYGTKRYAVMHNDFIIIGPASDPAGIQGLHNGAQALTEIAEKKSLFISRGDDSGTHTKELSLWKNSGVELITKTKDVFKDGKKGQVSNLEPVNDGRWYMPIGQGMGKTITFAEERQGYTLADRGTYIKYRYGKTPAIDLQILCEGGEALTNPYGIIPVNPQKYPDVQYALAMKFVDWIRSKRGQELIAGYRLEGHQLFFPDVR